MNDNDELGSYGIPDWAEEIIEAHDLGLRADAPLSAAIVLLTDAAADLAGISETAFGEQALTINAISRMSDIVSMVEDARKLSALCPHDPTVGTVHDPTVGTVAVSADGPLTWAPMSSGDH